MNYPASPSHLYSSQTEQLVPKKQQWALINQYKALEFERMKQMEKALDMEKKRQFKQQLDNQLHNKNDTYAQQKEADRKYKQFITRKSEQMKQKEENEKLNKIMKRRMVQEENQFYLDHMRNSRQKDNDSGYHLDIGLKSQIERKNRQDVHKRQMLDTLDKQLQLKADQKRRQRVNSLEMDQANLKYQYDQYDKRRSNGKRFGQNQNVYQYYKNLDHQRRIKQIQFEHRLVDEAAMKKMEEEDYKRYMKERQKQQKTNQMRHVLEQQVDISHRKAEQEKRVNPQQNTYSVIGNMFKDRPSPYNKQQYSQYLRRQAQQANNKKKRSQYMSQEEYRINMNQLNRAVSGTYAYNKYLDRSVGAIGDNSKRVNLTQMNQKINDEDSEVVRQRLENLKQRQRPIGQNDSYMY